MTCVTSTGRREAFENADRAVGRRYVFLLHFYVVSSGRRDAACREKRERSRERRKGQGGREGSEVDDLAVSGVNPQVN